MALIGSLAVNIVARTDQLKKGLGSAAKSVDGFASRVGAATAKMAKFGAAATAAGVGLGTIFVKQQFAAVDSIAKMSDRLGIATEKLTGLHHAAQLAGIGQSTLDMALQRMVRRTSEAAQGSGEAVSALQELGLSAMALSRLSPDKQLGRVADALNRVGGQGDRIRLAFKLFDSEGVALLNLTQAGSEGIGEMIAQAERLGLTFDRAAAAKIEAANDAVTRLKGAFGGLGRTLAIEVAPAVESMANWIGTSLERSGTLQSVFRGIGQTFEFIRNAIDRLHVVFLKTQVGFNKIIVTMGEGLNALARKAIEFINKIPGVELKSGGLEMSFVKELQRTNERIIHQIGQVQADMRQRALDRSLPAPTGSPFFRELSDRGFGLFGAGVRGISGGVEDLVNRLARLAGGLPAAPQMRIGGTPSLNAALEAGTREAFIAQRSGGRQEFLKEVAKFQKEEVNISKEIKGVLTSIGETLKQTATQVISIPSA